MTLTDILVALGLRSNDVIMANKTDFEFDTYSVMMESVSKPLSNIVVDQIDKIV
jgi:hypothetical protein